MDYNIPVQDDESTEMVDSIDFEDINDELFEALEEPLLTPQTGLQRVANILNHYGIEIPVVFEMDSEGDEYIFRLENNYLYFIFSPNESGFYEVFAQVVDEDELHEILSDDGEDNED
jgi:hypothetical protein